MGKKINKTFIFLILISLLTILPFFTWSPKINLNTAHADESWGNWSAKENTSELKDFPKENAITNYSWEDEHKHTLYMEKADGMHQPKYEESEPIGSNLVENIFSVGIDKSKTYDFDVYKKGNKERLDTNIIDKEKINKITIKSKPHFGSKLNSLLEGYIGLEFHYEYYIK